MRSASGATEDDPHVCTPKYLYFRLGAPILLICLVFLFGAPLVQGQDSLGNKFHELLVVSGGTLKPNGGPIFGFGYGFGFNRNLIGVQVSRLSLGEYGLGIGKSVFPNQSTLALQEPISNSRLVEFGANFQRDLYADSRRNMMAFVSGGGSYIRSTFTVSHECGLLCPFPQSPTDLVSSELYADTWGVSFGGGVRVHVWKSFGIRAEVEYTATAKSNIPSGRGLPKSIGSDHVSRATVGLYFRR